MNETELTVEEVRLALGENTNARGYRSFSSEGKVAAVTFALKRLEGGASSSEIADELGLKGWTLQRWLQHQRRSDGPQSEGFHRVEVKAPPKKKTVVVRGACGVSVEGLAVDDVARLLRELSCSA
jgi:transposase-like protein